MNDAWNDYMVVGALGFSGIASKTWKSILERVQLKDIVFSDNLPELLSNNVPNIGPKRIQTILEELNFYKEDLMFILNKMNINYSYGKASDSDIQIRFSGVRNSTLVELLSTFGIDIDDSSVTKNTTILIVPYNGYTSGKVTKAEQYGAKIIPLNEFLEKSE